MADKAISDLPAASGFYDDTLLVAENQGEAVKITGRQVSNAVAAQIIGEGGGGVITIKGEKGDPGEDGATFFPDVTEDGLLTWSNDKGLPNPAPVNIKGPPGDGGGSGGGADLSNAVTILGGAHIVLDGDFGNPPYEIRISASGISVISSYTVTLSVAPSGGGTVTGEGSYRAGSTVTITASPGEGYSFSRWERNGVSVSTGASYSFIVTEDTELTAFFEAVPVVPALGEWSETALPETDGWESTAYGDGKFVTVASNSNKAAYSTDGINWTAATLPSSAYWNSVAYGGGKFVAVSAGGHSAVSTDCVNWTEHNTPSSCTGYWQGIAYGGGKFIAVGYLDTEDGTKKCAASSTDGKTWTPIDIGRAYWKSIAYGNGMFVAVSNADHRFACSDDGGASWNLTDSPYSSVNFQAIEYGGGYFIAVSTVDADGSTVSAYSEDGLTWDSKSLPFSGRWYDAAFGNGKFVTIANGSNQAAYLSVG